MRHRASLAAALLLACGLPAAGQAAPAPVPCVAFDHGPVTSAKPVTICVGYRAERPVVNVSTDRGRTWSERLATGTPEPLDHLLSVLVSPAYDSDRTIYLHYQALGLFASTDGGATFTSVDVQGGNERGDRVSAIHAFGPSTVALPTEPAVAIPGRGPGVLYRGQHLPVVGSGNQQDRGFHQVGHGDGAVVLAVSEGPDESLARRTRVSQCTRELACPGGYTFPAGLTLASFAVDPAPKAQTAVALLNLNGTTPSVWATTDRGKTFARNASFDRAAAPYLKPVGQVWTWSVAVLPGGRVWLAQIETPRDMVLLMTADAGRSWSRRAYPRNAHRIVATPDGRLFGGDGMFRCSVDQARSWHDRCPR